MNGAKLKSVLATPFSCRRTTANYGLLRLYKDCKWSAPCLSTQTLPRRSLLSRYTRQCYLIYTLPRNPALSAAWFASLAPNIT